MHAIKKISEVIAMYWFILFVRTGREYKIEQFLKQKLETEKFIPFVPLHETIFRKSRIVKKELRPLFPSYVFINSYVSGQEFLKKISPIICTDNDIIRVLRYSDTEIAIRESEKQMLLSLCNDDNCIESSSGIIDGDRIYITHGPLKGRESIVKKVNRHKCQAWIEIEFMGDNRLVSVALEIIEKIKV
jgi:transcriptional antiterminator NusG